MYKNNYVNWPCLFILLFSIFNMTTITSKYLEADIIMYSIMSLQNVTLYYWGQNRLLNVIPYVCSIFKEPSINLYAIIILNCLIFYSVIYYISKLSSMFICSEKNESVIFNVFLFILCGIHILFKDDVVYFLSMHYVYSLPILLLLYSLQRIICKSINKLFNIILLILSIFISIGVNPSIIVPLLFFISIYAIYHKKNVDYTIILLFVLCISSFMIWNYISSNYGGQSYSKFNFIEFEYNIRKCIFGILNTINLPKLIIYLLIFDLLKYNTYCITRLSIHNSNIIRLAKYAISISIFFSIMYLFLFSNLEWIHMNNYHFRYFSYIYYVFIFIFSIVYTILYILNKKKAQLFLILISIIMIIQGFSANFNHILDGYTVFKRINNITNPGNHLFAGNYWDVWPSVMRDLMHGYKSYGLCFRGNGNIDTAKKNIFDRINMKGNAEVYCLNSSVKNCIEQVESIAGHLPVMYAAEYNDCSHLIYFTLPTSIMYSGNNLSNLPSQVGALDNKHIFSRYKSGYLVYGPYTQLKSGKYSIKLYGTVKFSNKAYVDIVSGRGSNIHARFDIKEISDSGIILDDCFNLSSHVSDLEIRIWVSELDVIIFDGYTVQPFRK